MGRLLQNRVRPTALAGTTCHWRFVLSLAWFLIGGLPAAVGAGEAPKEGVDATYTHRIRPILQKYCFACHGGTKPKGDLRLDTLVPDFRTSKTATTWKEVRDRVAGQTADAMPPKEKPQPSAEEVKALRDWIGTGLTAAAAADAASQAAEGRAQMRRLNRVEHNNTLRDLLGISVDLKPLLPEDEAIAGFDNVGAGLQITRIHHERYLEAAEAALNAAIVQGAQPKSIKARLTYQKADYPPRRLVKDDTWAFFISAPAEVRQFRPTAGGRYRIRVSAYAYQNQGRPMVMHVSAGDPAAPDEKYFAVAADKPTVVELTARVSPRNSIQIAPYGLGLIYIRDLANYQGPGLAVEWVEVEGPLWDSWPPESYQRLLGKLDLKKASLTDAEQVLRDFVPRAFRRPVPDAKVNKYIEFLRGKVANGSSSVEEALRQALMAVLCAPDFLLLYETPGPLNDFALAARLSYFLWRSMPDQPLLDLAAQKKLRSPEELRRQVERLLQDPRAAAFAENFLGQWLGLRQIDATTPDRVLYPEFDNYLKYSMLKEPQLFFEEMLKNDLKIQCLIDSDFSMLNDRLARHYGIEGALGPEFRKVKLPSDCRRGGVLTMAAVLKITANGTVTSPVLRGAWVLNNIMGQPLQLPSDLTVPAVEPDIRGAVNIRDQLAKHRTVAQCASCHQKIDPPGFALENFDPIGGYRTKYRALGKYPKANVKIYDKPVMYSDGLAVEAGDIMPNGKRFKDSDEFKKLLLEDSGPFIRTLAEKLVVYATGNPVRPSDRAAVDGILQRVRDKNDGLRTLVHELVQSELFLSK